MMSKEHKYWQKSITLIEGCTSVSAGCEHCWSGQITHRFHQAKGLTTNGHFNGKIITREDRLHEMLDRKKPTRWVIWNDLFHESIPITHFWPDKPLGFIDKFICEVVGWCPEHTFLVLTKRPQRALEYFRKLYAGLKEFRDGQDVKLPQLWLGVTCENQKTADERIPILLQIPAAVRFVSFEPLLGPIVIPEKHLTGEHYLCDEPSTEVSWETDYKIDWAIIGCESLPGGKAGRFCEDEDRWWQAARDIKEQFTRAGLPVFMKQGPVNGKVEKNIDKFPENLRLRQWPSNAANVKK